MSFYNRISFCIAIVLFSISIGFKAKAQLSGTYTINASISASSSNYKNFTSAVNDLAFGTRTDGGTANGKGVKGAVVFNIANGTYTESISIYAITGSSATNTITFQSSTKDSSKVRITYPSSTSLTSTILLSATKYIIFNQITVDLTGTYKGYAISSNASSYNKFLHCVLLGPKNVGASICFNNSYCTDTGNIITNNLIKRAFNGILMTSITTGKARYRGLVVENNVFDSSSLAIQLDHVVNASIKNNRISNISAGIQLSTCDSAISVQCNKITLFSSQGTYIYNCAVVPSSRTLICNNMLSGSGIGMYFDNIQNYDIINNSILLSSSSGKVFYMTSTCKTNKIYNNLFIENTTGYALYGTIDTSNRFNYNILYASGSPSSAIINFNLTDYKTYSSFRTASKINANGSFSLPTFFSQYDLHTNDTMVRGKGATFASVPYDIDNQLRKSIKSDAGADEHVSPVDISLAGIKPIPLPVCDTIIDIKLKITNTGSKFLDSAKLTLSQDGTQLFSKFYKIKLSSFKDTTLTITQVKFKKASALIKVYASLPNNITDSVPANDTSTLIWNRGMAGNYTIGGTGSNYSSINSAISDLTLKGVCGAVTFKIANGTYTEQVVIPAIAGASNTNRITFTSASGDSSKVLLIYSTYNANSIYTLFLNGGSYFTFKNIGIQIGVNNAHAVDLGGGASYNYFLNDRITGYRSNASLEPGATIYTERTSLDSENVFSNNCIKYGSISICANGIITIKGGTPPERGLVITNNIIDSFYNEAIKLDLVDSAVISGNIITSNVKGITAIMDGVFIDNLTLTNNKIWTNISEGFALSYSKHTGPGRGLIANNMISTSSIYYIFDLAEFINYDIVYNSIFNTNTTTSSISSFSIDNGYSTGHNRLINNIIAGATLGTTAKIAYTTGSTKNVLDTSSNNDIFGGKYLVNYGGTNYTTLSSYHKATGFDSNSISVDPLFKSSTDLHATSTAIINKGIPIASVKKDIDGNTRNPKFPDIGANEFGEPPFDASVDSLIAPVNTFTCDSVVKFGAKISNQGTSNFDSLKVQVYLNDTLYKSAFYHIKLTSKKDSNVILGTLIPGFLKPIKFMVKISYPNNQIDTRILNDTLSTHIQRKLVGTFTIGGNKADFKDFTAAVIALQKSGICGNTVFKVKDSTYQEQINLTNINGLSKSSTLTFQSASGDSSKVILSYPSSSVNTDNFTLQLKSVSYITLKGLTITRQGITYSYTSVINFSNSHHISIQNCALIGRSISTGPIITSVNSSSDSFNVIKNNHFTISNGGIMFNGTASSYEKGNIIQNNIFDSVAEGIALGYQSNFIIKGNKITSWWGSSYSDGMYIQSCKDGGEISSNTITIRNASLAYGIEMTTCTANGNKGLIANNMISLNGSAVSNGIILQKINNFNIVHNSIITDSNKKVTGACLQTGSNSGINVFNNSFLAKKGKNCIHLGNTNIDIDSCDNNNLYADSIPVIWYNTSYKNLVSYQKGTNLDLSSISVNVKFKSFTDLHTNDGRLNGIGKPLSYVRTDIDGETRKKVPDIGADEFFLDNDLIVGNILTPVNNTCGDSNTTVAIQIVNQGKLSQSNFGVQANISGNLNTSLTQKYTKTLAPGASDTVYFSQKINTFWGGVYNIKAFTKLANDQHLANDTVLVSIIIQSTPIRPIVRDTQLCGTASVPIKAATTGGAQTLWYTSDTAKTPVYKGSTFLTPKLSKATRYYVSASNGTCESPRVICHVNIQAYPNVNLSFGNACTNLPFSFHNQAINTDTGFTYKWTFGDGFTSTDSMPTHSYTTEGTYNVKLKVWNANKCSDSFVKSITVYATPNIGFSFNNACENTALIFTNSSVNKDTAISYKWVFGDGGFSSNKAPQHTYTTVGNYHVVLKGNSSHACADSVSKTITVNNKPSVSFSFGNACKGDQTSFNNTSVNIGSSLSYKWNFDDGSNSTDVNPKHVFTTEGTYSVKLVATNALLCADSTSNSVIIHPLPDAGYSVVYNSSSLSFMPYDTTLSSYAWNFGDNGTSTIKKPAHTFAHNGIYYIKLSVVDKSGCSSSFQNNIPVTNAAIGSINYPITSLNAYPNPFQNELHIAYDIDLNTALTINLYNESGVKITVLNKDKEIGGTHNLIINAANFNLNPGPYILEIVTDGAVSREKIMLLSK